MEKPQASTQNKKLKHNKEKLDNMVYELRELNNAIENIKKNKKSFKLSTSLPRAVKDVHESETNINILRKPFDGALDSYFSDNELSNMVSRSLFDKFMEHIKFHVRDEEMVFDATVQHLNWNLYSKMLDLRDLDRSKYKMLEKELKSYQEYEQQLFDEHITEEYGEMV